MDEYKSTIINLLSTIWNAKLFEVSNHVITVSSVITGIISIYLAFWFAKNCKIILTKRLLTRFDLNRQQITTFENIIYYILLTIFILIALQIANIPLTAFTIIGGAIVIGIGFGSQSVVNNFMSGLIILAEQPVKIGDVIEIDHVRGVVERLGARSTCIRSMYHTHVIIPNSMILGEKVINWTLSYETVLVQISVGFAYGSDTDMIQKILIDAVEATEHTLSEPKPLVLFTNFGSSSLDFTVLFGINLKNHLERQVIESNVRFKIDNLARQNNLVIAFPQADVHLDVSAPIEFKKID